MECSGSETRDAGCDMKGIFAGGVPRSLIWPDLIPRTARAWIILDNELAMECGMCDYADSAFLLANR